MCDVGVAGDFAVFEVELVSESFDVDGDLVVGVGYCGDSVFVEELGYCFYHWFSRVEIACSSCSRELGCFRSMSMVKVVENILSPLIISRCRIPFAQMNIEELYCSAGILLSFRNWVIAVIMVFLRGNRV